MNHHYYCKNPNHIPHGRGGGRGHGMGGHGRGAGMSGGRGKGDGMASHQYDSSNEDAQRSYGAQTFRRGRILSFLDRLFVKKETLENQIKQEQYQDLKPMISGELKAVEAVINEYIQEFDLAEFYDQDTEK